MAWSIPAQERLKYDQIFDGLQPINGLLSGDKVKDVFLYSKLPVDVLGKVWELSDIDGDGLLDREEFTVAMHLVYRALEKIPVPMQLPPEMIPLNKRNLSSISIVGGIPGLTSFPVQMSNLWTVSPADKVKYDDIFNSFDTDKDGFLLGADSREIFLKSGLPQLVLAHIWSLCDTNMVGKLNSDQFALGMHLIQQKLKGIELPTHITNDMLPPSIRKSEHLSSVPIPLIQSDQSLVKELDDISKEIEELKKEKLKYEQEKAQKEADLMIQNGQISSLQKDLDSLLNTIKQLESQKSEAQMKLDELDDKKNTLQNSVAEYKKKYDFEMKKVQDLRNRLKNKDSKHQEEEIRRMKDEITMFKQQELELQKKHEINLSSELLLNEKITELQTFIAQAMRNIEDLKKSLDENDVEQSTIINDANIKVSKLADLFSQPTMDSFKDISDKYPEIKNDAFGGMNILSDPFKSEDIFGTDPFATTPVVNVDPFGGDPFIDAFPDLSSTNIILPAFSMMNKESSDPWNSIGHTDLLFNASSDNFDPFAVSSSKNGDFQVDPSDPFGSGSFMPPTNAIVSPHLPILPPKLKRAPPPPRPPAPKPNESLSGVVLTDSFEIHGMNAVSGPSRHSENSSLHNRIKKDLKKDLSPKTSKIRSEAEQLAWAKRDSEQEYERQRRIKDQEEADFELAIALSKPEIKSE